ncbi:DNA repair protein RecO [Teredinibacter purpureus]|uniref:DNA repair protein RecO n=1 Tax=Teredinibacter purpureus TaxID=2731756 RepID=UPI0005F82AC5|nr:DNA repair protein RecO [Teredinibacter purpureus]
MLKVEDELAFVLHWRNFTDSRIIIDFFTQHYGRVSTVFRTRHRKSSGSSKPQQFVPLSISYHGKNTLRTLSQIEIEHPPLLHAGESLYCGMYINELIQRLFAAEDPHPRLFEAYHRCLQQLSVVEKEVVDVVLREFEFLLLDDLGVGIDFLQDAQGNSIEASSEFYYTFSPTQGFTPVVPHSRQLSLRGSQLQAIAEGRWAAEGARLAAKQVCRVALNEALGGKPLVSRELFK